MLGTMYLNSLTQVQPLIKFRIPYPDLSQSPTRSIGQQRMSYTMQSTLPNASQQAPHRLNLVPHCPILYKVGLSLC